MSLSLRAFSAHDPKRLPSQACPVQLGAISPNSPSVLLEIIPTAPGCLQVLLQGALVGTVHSPTGDRWLLCQLRPDSPVVQTGVWPN